VPEVLPDAAYRRAAPPALPQQSETELSRHYSALARRAYGVNDGFYPLGSCTMKYNPAVNEEIAALPGFTGIHPLQPAETAQGCLAVLGELEKALCEITGIDAFTFQPAAGAHGEFTGLLTHQGLPPQPRRRGPHEDHRAGLRPRHQPRERGHGRLHGGEHPLRAGRLRRPRRAARSRRAGHRGPHAHEPQHGRPVRQKHPRDHPDRPRLRAACATTTAPT
jgi:hypothetical protein